MSRAFALRTDDNALKVVAVSISATTSGTSSADPELQGGRIIGWYPSAGLGVDIQSIAIAAATGVVTVTLASSDTCTIQVIVQKER